MYKESKNSSYVTFIKTVFKFSQHSLKFPSAIRTTDFSYYVKRPCIHQMTVRSSAINMLSMPFCATSKSFVHSVVGISKGHLSLPNDFNLSLYHCRSVSGNLQTIIFRTTWLALVLPKTQLNLVISLQPMY